MNCIITHCFNYGKILTVVAALFVFSATADAEILKDAGRDFGLFYALDVKIQQEGGSYEKQFTYVNGLLADVDGLETVRMFCSDIKTSTSDAFYAEGQKYNTSSLNDSVFHTELQKGMLQSLFDHVYTDAFNEDYSHKDTFLASIFQLAIWEITAETSGTFDINKNSATKGSFYVDGGYENAGDLTTGKVGNWNVKYDMTDVWSTVNGWLAAAQDETGMLWQQLGYDYNGVGLTVHLADGGAGVSQTFINVSEYHVATPEPATMLIFGIGVSGLALANARRRK